ncbi:MAG: succinate--CoA ligase subunit beta [Spirochaetia bacterium]
MKVFEYQAKEAFSKFGIQVPESGLARTAAEVGESAEKVGYPCVVKSQVLRGGRGKAGLIQLAHSRDEAEKKALELFESKHNVKTILVEQAVNIEKEIYVSITVDAEASEAVIIACLEGGVEIETLAVESPEKIVKERVNLFHGLLPFHTRNVAFNLGLKGDVFKAFTKVLQKMYKVFREYDAELVEVNPLFITTEGELVAGDGKLSLDDNSLFRHPEFKLERVYFDSDTAFEAAKEGIPYLQFDGDISLMCAGAGLTTTVYDLINYAGGSVANYLEFGGPNYRKAMRAMELCLENESKVILIVTFGTIARADVMAEGVVEAISKLKPDRPIVTCIRGTNEEKAKEILSSAGLQPIFDTEEAVQKAVDLAKEAK